MNDLRLMLAALAGTVTIVGACGCSHLDPVVNYQPPAVTPPAGGDETGKVICDFETVDIGFSTNDALQYSVVENADKANGNASDHYGQVISAGGQWELIYSKDIEPFNFTRDGAIFTMKVNAPKVNGKSFAFLPEVSAPFAARGISFRRRRYGRIANNPDRKTQPLL